VNPFSRKYNLLFFLVLLPVLLAGCDGKPEPPPLPGENVEVGDRRGALVDEVVFTQESDIAKIVELIEGGSHQVFAQGITNATVFRRIRDSARADHEISYGSTAELTVNPAGPMFLDGRINPFYVPEIREALNWLVNRRYVAEELYGGLAVPRYLPLSTAFPDYARLADAARVLEIRYRYDPERARRVIHEEMKKLGATLGQEGWVHEGEPIRITLLIRNEDERRRVGDYVARLMEQLGFRVERLYRTAEEASRIWILGDPNAGRWHLYTGSWVSTVINRDQAEGLNFYYTPRGRPEPLWQAYRPDRELDEIADLLQRRAYSTWEQRQEMMARGLALAMKDSVRVWLVDQINVWPRARNIGLAVDLAGGISGSFLWPYTIHYRDRIGGRVVFGTPSLLTEPWNPVDGSNWLFDTMIQRALEDSSLLPDPFTGLLWPQRIESARVFVQEDVPVIRTHDWLEVKTEPEIRVPEEAWIDWDPLNKRFVTVGEKHPEGMIARTRTVVRYEDDYLDRRWHDGTRVSLADVVLPWILMFERSKEQSPLYDVAHVPRFEVFQRHYRGWRILSKEPLKIEIYSDQIYPDAEWIVGARAPGAAPWHTLALGIRAEQAGELAFSSNKADRTGVSWMSYVSGPSLPVLARHLETSRNEGYVPFAGVLGDFLREGEVEDRYRALWEWYGARRHFWVGDGPFYLHSVHPVERSVVIRRYDDFPDRSDKWLRFTDPEIPVLDIDAPLVVEAGDRLDLSLRIEFEGEPYPAGNIETARYMLFDSRGRLAMEGGAEPGEDGQWKISLSSDRIAMLGFGANSLEVAVTSRRVAMPVFATHVFATVPRQTAPSR
jgi:peptide/nickel transport system substrate-binding protein